ncbi:MAG: hypothetical protein ACJAZW_002406 [Maritalea sp.]|jgi:hypothetical protein
MSANPLGASFVRFYARISSKQADFGGHLGVKACIPSQGNVGSASSFGRGLNGGSVCLFRPNDIRNGIGLPCSRSL